MAALPFEYFLLSLGYAVGLNATVMAQSLSNEKLQQRKRLTDAFHLRVSA